MPSRVVVVLGRGMQRKREIIVRAYPLCCVNHASLQRGEDLAARQHDGHAASPREHLATNPWYAHLQTLKVFDGVDFFVKPTGHLHPGVTCSKGYQVELAVKLPPKRQPAAIAQPTVHFLCIHAKGYGGEHRRRGILAAPVVGRSVAHLRGALRNRVKDF